MSSEGINDLDEKEKQKKNAVKFHLEWVTTA